MATVVALGPVRVGAREHVRLAALGQGQGLVPIDPGPTSSMGRRLRAEASMAARAAVLLRQRRGFEREQNASNGAKSQRSDCPSKRGSLRAEAFAAAGAAKTVEVTVQTQVAVDGYDLPERAQGQVCGSAAVQHSPNTILAH